MELIKENLVKVKNQANLIQFFVYSLIYKDLDEPITNKIYPHEFNSWNDFNTLKTKLRKESSSLAQKLYREQQFKKQQLELNLDEYTEDLNA